MTEVKHKDDIFALFLRFLRVFKVRPYFLVSLSITLERTDRSLLATEQRTIVAIDDPFAFLTDEQLAMIANSIIKVKIIDERITQSDNSDQ